MRKYSYILLLALVVVGCAKQRDLEKFTDEADITFKKADFLGSESKPKRWLSKVTVVKTSMNGEGFAFVGFNSETKLGHFEFTQSQLRFLNELNLDPRKSDATTQSLINAWEITHHDVKLEEKDGNTTNREVEDKEKPDLEKRFFKIKFDQAKIKEREMLPIGMHPSKAGGLECFEEKSTTLIGKPEMGPEYVSFVIGADYIIDPACTELRRRNNDDAVYTVHYRYAFKKYEPSPTYQPFVYKNETDPRRKLFGYFETRLEHFNGGDGRPQVTLFANRWNPNTEHNYYFTKDFPEAYKSYFSDPRTGIFATINRHLEKANLKVRFHIRENTWGDGKIKEFGDNRYSFVKIVPEFNPGAPFGYGPSDTDPLTGEIISANVVLWTGLLDYYLESIRRSVDRNKDKFSTSSLFTTMKHVLKTDPSHWATPLDLSKGRGKLFSEVFPHLLFSDPRAAKGTSHKDSSIFYKESVDDLHLRHASDAQIFEPLYKKLNETSQLLAASEREVLNPANQVLDRLEFGVTGVRNLFLEGVTPQQAIRTIVHRAGLHEVLHTLGFRHNFAGSIDSKNFPPPVRAIDTEGRPILDDKGKQVVWQSRTSTQMEYLTLHDEIHLDIDLGSYDEAGLSYLYSDGNIAPTKNYLYCTDEHTLTNAMCNRFDNGTSPSEIAFDLVQQYENSYFENNYRNGRAYWDESDAEAYEAGKARFMHSLKKFQAMRTQVFTKREIETLLEKHPEIKVENAASQINGLRSDMERAVMIVVAFYHAVIQQSASDRPWLDHFDRFTGEKERIGIAADKFHAVQALLYHRPYKTDLNEYVGVTSFMQDKGTDTALQELIDDVTKYALTKRVDMYPGFIDTARQMYAITATDHENQSDTELIDKLKLVQFDQAELKKYLDIDWNDFEKKAAEGKTTRDSDRIVHETIMPFLSDDPGKILYRGFHPGEQVAVVYIEPFYYVASVHRNPVATSAIELIRKGAGDPVRDKEELLQMARVYNALTGKGWTR